MGKSSVWLATVLFSIIMISGCTVRTYQMARDRVDQDLSMGNRGFLQGDAPAPTQERKTTRDIRVVEVEMSSPLKFEKGARRQTPVEKAEPSMEEETMGNRGYLSQSVTPEEAGQETDGRFEKYTVQKGDTLQKISKKLYGTTKRWNKIFRANADVLKAPDRIYPGQVINVPVEGMKEPAENLK